MQSSLQNDTEPYIGKNLPQIEFMVTQEILNDYNEGLNLQYQKTLPLPSMIAGAADNFHKWSAFEQDRGHLWMRQEWQLFKPLNLNEAYIANGKIIDIYKKRDRTVVNTEMALKNLEGTVVIKSNHHQSFLLDEPIEKVEFRDPAKKEGMRKFLIPDGTAIPSLESNITLEMCGEFFHGNKSYHTDLKSSQKLGFNNVVVGGRMTMSYVGHLVEQHLGEDWWNSGELDIKFTNPVWPNDKLFIKGIDIGILKDNNKRRGIFTWIEKDDGTIVLIGNASIAN